MQQEELKRQALAVVDLEQEYGEVQKELQEYCRRVYSSTKQTLMETLGGSRFVRDNSTHLAKLPALVREKKVASNLLKAINTALRALMQDGFQGEVFQKIREEQPGQTSTFVLAYHSVAVEEIEETTGSDDDCNFLSDGGESGLEKVRSLVRQGDMRWYRAFGDLGYADMNDAASKEDRSHRKSHPDRRIDSDSQRISTRTEN